MATVVSATELPPGGEGKIEVKVSTRGRKGKLAKTITVESNDPKTPRFLLKVHGQVEVLAGFDPQIQLTSAVRLWKIRPYFAAVQKPPDVPWTECSICRDTEEPGGKGRKIRYRPSNIASSIR